MKDIKAVFDIGNDYIKATVFANDNEKDIVLAKQMEPNHGMVKREDFGRGELYTNYQQHCR